MPVPHRQKYELPVNGIHWDELDEDISVAKLLAGRGASTGFTKTAASLNASSDLGELPADFQKIPFLICGKAAAHRAHF